MYIQDTTTLRELRYRDIPELYALYQAIRISADNCGERLRPGTPRSFGQAGGMFVIPSPPELEHMAGHPGQYFTWVAQGRDSEILGFLWAPLEPAIPKRLQDIQYHQSAESLRKVLEQTAADSALLWGGEILVHPERRIPGLALQLFGALFSGLAQRGYKHKLGEVYRVTGCRLDGRFWDTDCYNARSHRLLLRSGGRTIGTLPERELALHGFSVRIRPVLFYWNIPQTADHLHTLASLMGDGKC